MYQRMVGNSAENTVRNFRLFGENKTGKKGTRVSKLIERLCAFKVGIAVYATFFL